MVLALHTLLLLLSLLLSSGGTASGSTASSGSGTTSTTRWDGSQLAGTLSDQLPRISLVNILCPACIDSAYLLEILALELGDQGGETLIVSLDSDGFEDLLDVLVGGSGVASDGEEEVCCEVLHLECCRGGLSVPVVKEGVDRMAAFWQARRDSRERDRDTYIWWEFKGTGDSINLTASWRRLKRQVLRLNLKNRFCLGDLEFDISKKSRGRCSVWPDD